MKISFSKIEAPSGGAVVVGVYEDRKLTPTAAQLDKQTRGAIERALAASRFKGKPDDLLTVLAPAGLEASRIVLVGLGKPGALDALGVQGLGGRLVAALANSGETAAAVAVDDGADQKLGTAEQAAHLAYGARLRSYRFDKYRTTEKPEAKPSLKKLTVMSSDPNAAKKAYDPLQKVSDGVFLTRDLVSEPANVIYPETLAQEAQKLSEIGVKVEVLGEKKMRELGMGALLGVGQGSERDSQLVVMQWEGAPDARNKAPVAFVGSGAAAFDLMEGDIREALAGTAGGRRAASLPFDTIADELPLIREGCAVQALTFVDQEIFGPGAGSAPAGPRLEAPVTARSPA